MSTRLGALLLSILLLLPGCWSYREINDLALVMAVGIDRTDAGRVRVTAQIARPIASGQGGGTSGAGGQGAPVYVATAEGRSIFEAIRNLALFTSRRIMWAHNKVIVVGRSQAEHGVQEIIDFFTRNPELRFRTLITLAEGDAQDVVGENTGMERQPADSIEKIFRYATIIGEAQKVDVKEFAAAYFDEGQSEILPVLRRRPRIVTGTAAKDSDPVEVLVQGLGVFDEGRLMTILNQQESRGVVLLRARAGRIVFTVPCGETTETVTVELLKKKLRIQPEMAESGRVRFAITVTTQVGITSVGCALNYRDQAVLNALEQRISRSLQGDILAAVARAQAAKTDPMGLGQHVRAKLPSQWAHFRANWPEQMAGAQVNVTVNTRVIGAELNVQPPSLEKEKRKGE